MRVRVDDGAVLFFDVEGPKLAAEGPGLAERPTLLLLHGGPGFDHAVFKPDFSALADAAQVVYLDQRGQGRSVGGPASDPATWTLARWADDVRAACDALGIERPVVLGNSFGGFVAQAYLERHPGHAAGVVLSSTAARMRLGTIAEGFARRGGPAARAAAEAFWSDVRADAVRPYLAACFPLYTARPNAAGSRTVLRPEVLERFAGRGGEMWAMDFRAALGRVRTPVLVLSGGLDPVTPPEAAEEIAACLPPGVGRLSAYPDCGHGVFRDDPARAFAEIRAFLRAVSGADG